VMEGSLRQAGPKLRVAVQVADTVSGKQLWAETYERPFTPETLFEIQDDLVPPIVATVADQNGVLTRSMAELVRNKNPETLTPHEAVMRAFSFFTRISQEEHAVIRDILERIVREFPDHADSWAVLALIYRAEYAQGYNPRPDPLARGLDAARRAVNLAPAQAMGHYALASIQYFGKDKVGFRVEAEKALALNPMDASAKALLGMLYGASGDWERGVKMVKSAIQMNPNCPGYFYIAGCCDAYRRGAYEEAIEDAIRMNMPDYFHVPAMLTACFGQLGRIEEAKLAAKNLLALRPDFESVARQEYQKWYAPENVEHLLDGLRKAGLEIPDAPGEGDREQADTKSPASGDSRANSTTGSGAARADEGFWVAVLPFKHNGQREETAALANGLSDDIITGLNRFSFLRVIAGSSTARYANENVDVRTAAKELGARYVLEGSLHQAGAKVRIATRLVDATTGAGLWAETYDRTFTPDAMLDLLDDVVPRIVSTVGDTQGILVHNMTEMLRHRDPNTLTPYEAMVRSFAYLLHVSEADHRDSVIALERAVKTPPVSADCWAMLAWLYRGEFMYGFNARADPLDRAFAAAQRALATDPSNMIAHAALASIYFSRRDLPAFRASAKRAVAVNRTEAYAIGYLGLLLAYSGEWDEGCALAERAAELHTSHPGWYWAPLALNAYRQGDGKRALEFAVRMNMPGVWSMYLIQVVIYAQLGEIEKARAAANDMLAVRPTFSADPRMELSAWFQPEMVEQMMGDLRKAGIQ
jgi:TolB-like protein/Tfp pilus assembly protein PilF